MTNLPHRKHLRLSGFDYASEGAYFITVVTQNREPLFGEIIHDEMVLSEFGRIVEEEWLRSASIRTEIELGAYVVMPNHFHGIVHIFEIHNSDHQPDMQPNDIESIVGAYGHTPLKIGTGDRLVAPTRNYPHGPKPKSLGALIAGFKSSVTTRINTLRGTPDTPVWQRNYYDHIIRNDRAYDAVEKYIQDNPIRWATDKENP